MQYTCIKHYKLLSLTTCNSLKLATLKSVLRKNNGKYQVNKYGLAVIYIQYGHNSENGYFSTDIRISPAIWQGDKDQNNPVKQKHQDFKKLNLVVSKVKSDLQQVVIDLTRKKMDPTVQAITDEFNKKDEVQGSNPYPKIWQGVTTHQGELTVGTI